MTKHVKLNKDGAIEVPAELVADQGWTLDSDLEVEVTANGLTFRAPKQQPTANPGFDYEEFRRRVPKHEGPPATLEDMERAIDAAMRERWLRKEAHSR